MVTYPSTHGVFEETIRDIGGRFGLAPEDLNLDLGPLGRLL